MFNTDQINIMKQLLGTPYKLGAQGPKEYDCWSYTRYIQKEFFGRELPSVIIEDESLSAYMKAIIEYSNKVCWTKIDKPIHGCIVELSRGNTPHHIGTYIEMPNSRGITHCLKGFGVVFDPINTLKVSGWRRFSYNVPN